MKRRCKGIVALLLVIILSAGLLPMVQAQAMDQDDIYAAYTTLKAAKEGDRVTVWADQISGIPTLLLKAIAGRNVTMTFKMLDYDWEINGLSVGNLDPDRDNYYLKIMPTTGQLPGVDASILVMQFQTVYQGKLPFEARLILPVGGQYAKKLLQLYQFDKDSNRVNFSALAPVRDSGAITLPFTAGGFFALTTSWAGGAYPDLFDDIQGHWASGNISLVSALNIFQGTAKRTFSPEGTITRGMFVTILGRMAGAPATQKSGFIDVKETDYWAPYIGWAKEAGIVAGMTENTFAPTAPITREQAAVILDNFLTKGFGYPKGAEGLILSFTDAQNISPWAKDSVAHLTQIGLLKGTGGGAFSPEVQMSRAEAAAVISRMLTGILAA